MLRYCCTAAALIAALTACNLAVAQSVQLAGVAAEPPTQAATQPGSMNEALASAFGQLLENSIPLEYERKKDWGQKKRITSGLKFADFDIKRRHKEVNHGVWKHYKVTLHDPEEKLHVSITDLQMLSPKQLGFTVHVAADLDLWARAKVYQYGVHLGSYETKGRTGMRLSFSSTLGVALERNGILPAVRIDPQVEQADFDLVNFRLERVSNASGPVVKEMSKTIERAIERELSGPKLVKKINRSIDKRRDRLVFSPGDLLGSSWWPVAQLPEVSAVVRK